MSSSRVPPLEVCYFDYGLEQIRLAGEVYRSSDNQIDSAFATFHKSSVGALIVGADAFFTTRCDQIVALAARYFIPAIYSQGLFSRI
jgi:hypothetical protein